MKALAALCVVLVLVACSGGGDSKESATSTTTTTIPPLDTARLVAALPAALEAPVGWTSSGGAPVTTLLPQEGPGRGVCGGKDADARAAAAGAIGVAHSGSFAVPQAEGGGFVTLYAFPTALAADQFATATSGAVISCPQGLEWEQPETEVHGFGGDIGGRNPTWRIKATSGLGAAGDVPADDAFVVSTSEGSSTDLDSVHYGFTTTVVVLYERHGDAVLLTTLSGKSGSTGFSDSQSTPGYVPTAIELVAAAGAIRPGILKDLGERPKLQPKKPPVKQATS